MMTGLRRASAITWGENPLNMTVADQDPNLAYGTDLGRTMRTTDGGATWNGVYSRKVNDEGLDDRRPGCHHNLRRAF